MASTSANIKEWSGLPVREIQLGDKVDTSDLSVVQEVVQQRMAEELMVQRGELRRVPKDVKQVQAAEHDLESKGRTKEKITTGHVTNYEGWSKFDDEEGPGAKDSLNKDADYDLVPVSEEEREREEIKQQAQTNALSLRERGNDAFKRGDFEKAVRLYTSGLRHLPSAVLFSNRAQARLRLRKFDLALKDADKALLMDPKLVKGIVRRASALEGLGRWSEADSTLRAARKNDPQNKDIKRAHRALEAASLEHQYEQTLLKAAELDHAEVASGDVAMEGGLPEEAKQQLREINEAVQLVSQAASSPGVVTGKALRSALGKLRRSLGAAERHRDLFALLEGPQIVLKVFPEDNQAVLAVLEECTRSCQRGCAALGRAEGVMDLLLQVVHDRRVSVICLGVEVLTRLLCGGHLPRMKAAAVALRRGSTLQTLTLMMARAPPSLHEKVLPLIEWLSSSSRACYEMRGLFSLAEGLARTAQCSSSHLQAVGVRAATDMAKRDAKLRGMLASHQGLAEAYAVMFRGEVEAAPEVRRVEFTAGVEVVYRDFGRLRQQRMELLTLTLQVLHEFALERSFVHQLDQMDMWPVLVPVLAASSQPEICSAAVQLAHRCCLVSAEATSALTELGATEIMVELAVGSGGDDVSTSSSAVASDQLKQRDSALGVMRSCASLPQFHYQLKDVAHGISSLARLLLTSPPSPSSACSSTSPPPPLSNSSLEATCIILHAAAAFHPDTLALLTHGIQGLGLALIGLWYSREGDTREAVEALLVRVMDSDLGSQAITQEADEGQILRFVADLRAKRQIQAAKRTGGANLLNPHKYNPSGVPLSAESQVEDQQRDQDLALIDAEKLHRYLSTLLPRTRDDPTPALADIMPGQSGRLSLQLAALFQADSGVHVYGVERESHLVDNLTRRANESNLRNFSAVLASAGGDEEEGAHTLAVGAEAVPVPVNLLLVVGVWLLVEDPAALLIRSLTRLKPQGKVCIIEDDPNVLLRATKVVMEQGFSVYAKPELLPQHYVCILAK